MNIESYIIKSPQSIHHNQLLLSKILYFYYLKYGTLQTFNIDTLNRRYVKRILMVKVL